MKLSVFDAAWKRATVTGLVGAAVTFILILAFPEKAIGDITFFPAGNMYTVEVNLSSYALVPIGFLTFAPIGWVPLQSMYQRVVSLPWPLTLAMMVMVGTAPALLAVFSLSIIGVGVFALVLFASGILIGLTFVGTLSGELVSNFGVEYLILFLCGIGVYIKSSLLAAFISTLCGLIGLAIGTGLIQIIRYTYRWYTLSTEP